MNVPAELIKKYNIPGPRYTSYPPVPFWKNRPSQREWIEQVKNNYEERRGLDLYVHVPFCESLCYYCGCNRAITKDHSLETGFVESLLCEWETYLKHLGLPPRINSLHFGGGTPTFLSPHNLAILLGKLTQNRTNDFIGSIEIDPRICTKAQLEVLKKFGVHRISLGIQDFDPEVQRAIHRYQTPRLVQELVVLIRSMEFESINFDLIYGLPKQTLKSIEETIDVVTEMRPELIAFYGYAHLPEKIKNQRLIKDDELPAPELKRVLYEHGKELLLMAGYVDIGMDHFALPGSFLYNAKAEKRIHRNFMGFVDKKSNVLLGLGPSSISESGLGFIQNAKDLKTYQLRVHQGELPIEAGHTHTPEDLKAQDIILKIMCQGEARLHQDFSQELATLEEDGLIVMRENILIVTPLGEAFVRNIAMCFDHHLREERSRVRFSQTV